MPSGFNITERIKRVNGVVVSHESTTTCAACGAELKSCEDWSHHRKIHTDISEISKYIQLPFKNNG